MSQSNQKSAFNYQTTVSAKSSVQVFRSSGTWVKPEGVTIVRVCVWGGGGGGGAGASGGPASSFFNQPGGGTGGGGGARQSAVFLADLLPSTVTITIGAGGAGTSRTSTGQNGAAGGTGGATYFGCYVKAFGGAGGGGGVRGASITPTTPCTIGTMGSITGGGGGGADSPGVLGACTTGLKQSWPHAGFSAAGYGGAPVNLSIYGTPAVSASGLWTFQGFGFGSNFGGGGGAGSFNGAGGGNTEWGGGGGGGLFSCGYTSPPTPGPFCYYYNTPSFFPGSTTWSGVARSGGNSLHGAGGGGSGGLYRNFFPCVQSVCGGRGGGDAAFSGVCNRGGAGSCFSNRIDGSSGNTLATFSGTGGGGGRPDIGACTTTQRSGNGGAGAAFGGGGGGGGYATACRTGGAGGAGANGGVVIYTW